MVGRSLRRRKILFVVCVVGLALVSSSRSPVAEEEQRSRLSLSTMRVLEDAADDAAAQGADDDAQQQQVDDNWYGNDDWYGNTDDANAAAANDDDGAADDAAQGDDDGYYSNSNDDDAAVADDGYAAAGDDDGNQNNYYNNNQKNYQNGSSSSSSSGGSSSSSSSQQQDEEESIMEELADSIVDMFRKGLNPRKFDFTQWVLFFIGLAIIIIQTVCLCCIIKPTFKYQVKKVVQKERQREPSPFRYETMVDAAEGDTHPAFAYKE